MRLIPTCPPALGGLALVGLIACGGFALAQPVGQSAVSGNECWNAGQGPGGPSQFLCLNVTRGGTANVLLSTVIGSFTIGVASGNATVLGTPGVTALLSGGNLLITAQPSAATITLPPNPIPDGAQIGVCNATTAAFVTNVVTVAANTGQTLIGTLTLTTQAANSCLRVQWNQSQATWYRIL